MLLLKYQVQRKTDTVPYNGTLRISDTIDARHYDIAVMSKMLQAEAAMHRLNIGGIDGKRSVITAEQ